MVPPLSSDHWLYGGYLYFDIKDRLISTTADTYTYLTIRLTTAGIHHHTIVLLCMIEIMKT